MRLEYTDEQEKQLRITEIESILANNLYENEVEELTLEVELQFLQGNIDAYGTSIAYIGMTGNDAMEITYEENEYFSMLIYNDGNPERPYYNADTVEELIKFYLEKVGK